MKKRPQDLAFRILAHPLRLLSLRSIVILAQLGVITLVLTLGVWVWVGVTNDQLDQLDRRLDSLSSFGDVNTLLRSVQDGTGPEPTENGLVRTARLGDATISVPADVVLPELPAGYADASIDGVEYRVRTLTTGNASIALGAPLAETQARIDSLHWRVFWICAGVILSTLLVGWVISLIMVNPFRLLAQQARAINAQSNPDEVQVRGVWEAVEISEAVEGMLARIGDEQQRTRAALESARDFAAVASHELRTPLTAMRTNLEVLLTLDLAPEQRKEVITDVMRTQSRIEATLGALERLAQGELTTVDDFVPVDVAELLDRAAHDAMHNYPGLDVSLASSTSVLMPRSMTSKPAPSSIMPTRFLPMSWMSPLTVPMTTLPTGRAPVSARSGRRMPIPAFMALADSSTSGTNRIPSRKSMPTMRMPSTRASSRTFDGPQPRPRRIMVPSKISSARPS